MAGGDLFGLMEAPAPATNLLFALMVYPPHEAALAAQARGRTYQADLRRGGSLFPLDRMHVTLGKFEVKERVESFVERVSRAIARLKLAPFEVVFDQIGGFSSGNVVLQGRDGLASLKDLQAAVRQALAWEKLDKGLRQFTPHMTVIYGQPGEEIAMIEPVRWTVREFALVISHQGEARHEVLARFPLNA
jgi:2'-5' RNA ligase